MPTVPVYDRPQAELNQLRRPDPDGARFAGEAGRVRANQTTAFAGALGSTAETFDRIEMREANREAFSAESALKKQWNDYSAVLQKNRQNNNAKGVTDEVEKWWSENGTKATGTLTNSRAKRMVEMSAERLKLSAMGEFKNFEMAQLDNASTAAFKATVDSSIEAAAANPAPENVALHKAAALAAVKQRAVEKGWSAVGEHGRSVLDNELLAVESKINVAVFSGMLRKNDILGAEKFLEANRSRIDARVSDDLDAKLRPIKLDYQASEFAAQVSALPFEEQIKKVNEIKDVDLRSRAAGVVKENDSLQRAATAQREKAVSDAVWQQVAQGASLRQLPANLLMQMDGKERVALNEHYRAAAARARTEAEGRAVKTDFKTYEELVNLPPDQFLRTRLSAYQDKIGRGDLEKLIDRQAKLRNPDTASTVASTEQQMGTYVSALGLKDDKRGAFQQAAYNEIAGFVKVNKREPTYDERQKLLDRLSMQHDGGWFGASKRYYEVASSTPEDRAKFMEQAVPEKDRKEITEALSRRGVPVTVQNILDAYRIANPGKQQ
jgi:hypothetical protein